MQTELFARDEVVVLRDGEADVTYHGAFLTAAEADAILDAATREPLRPQERITIHGKTHDVPRLTQWYSSDGRRYSYSGIDMEPRPYPDFMAQLAERISQRTNLAFNSVLMNLYRDGRDKVGWHSDDERELGDKIDIASVSLGAQRRFKLRRRRDHSKVVELALSHGSLLVMRHPTQRHWQHCLPPRRAVTEPRYNLTFRYI